MSVIDKLRVLGGNEDHRETLIKEQNKLVKKWEQTGLLEGLKDSTRKRSMATLLENQKRQILTEATTTGTGAESEAWAQIALPTVRRQFGDAMIINELVGVQPMNAPTGLVFYLDFKYGTNAQGRTGSIYGGTGAQFGITDEATGGLYGAGSWGLSLNNQTSAELTLTSGSNATLATYNDVWFNTTLSASVAAGKVIKVTLDKADINSALNENGTRAFTVVSSSVAGVKTLNAYNVYQPGTDKVVLILSASSLAALNAGKIKVSYHIQPTLTSGADFEWKGTDLNISEINMEIKKKPITAKTRKLKAVYTQEALQDMQFYQSIDAEQELVNVISEYSAMEQDLEMLDMLISRATTTDYWSAKVGYEWDSNAASFVSNATGSEMYQKSTWFQTLGIKVAKVSNQINKLTMAGGATFAVVSPEVATVLESMPGFTTVGSGDQFAFGATYAGSIASQIKVYKVPYLNDNIMLLGHKGNNFFQVGATYNPYIPFEYTQTILDPVNMVPRKGFQVRYGNMMINPAYYAVIKFAGLEQL